MTKKDYEKIAEVFQAHRKRYGGRTDAVIVEVIGDMCAALAAENSRFDSARFIAACGVQGIVECVHDKDNYGKCTKCGKWIVE